MPKLFFLAFFFVTQTVTLSLQNADKFLTFCQKTNNLYFFLKPIHIINKCVYFQRHFLGNKKTLHFCLKNVTYFAKKMPFSKLTKSEKTPCSEHFSLFLRFLSTT